MGTWGAQGHQAAHRHGTAFLTKQPCWKDETHGETGMDRGPTPQTALETSTGAEGALWGLSSCRNTAVAVTIQLEQAETELQFAEPRDEHPVSPTAPQPSLLSVSSRDSLELLQHRDLRTQSERAVNQQTAQQTENLIKNTCQSLHHHRLHTHPSTAQ